MVLEFVIFQTARICMCDRRYDVVDLTSDRQKVENPTIGSFEPNENSTMDLKIYPIKNICE